MLSAFGMDKNVERVKFLFLHAQYEPHAVGNTWKEPYDDETGKGEISYTLLSKDNNKVVLAYTAKGALEKDTESKGMEVHVSMNTNRKGESEYDIRTGLLENQKETGTMDGYAEIKSMNMKIPNSSTYSSTTMVSKQ